MSHLSHESPQSSKAQPNTLVEKDVGDVPDGSNRVQPPQEHSGGVLPASSAGGRSNRWQVAGQVIRQKSQRIAERLGRSADPGDGLEPSMKPEYSGATDDLALTAAVFHSKDTPQKTKQSRLWDAINLEADRLLRRSNKEERGRGHRLASSTSSFSFPGGDADADAGAGAKHSATTATSTTTSSSTSTGGVLSQLLNLHVRQSGRWSTSDLLSPGSDGVSNRNKSSSPFQKEERVKWYQKPKHQSTGSLIQASMEMGSIGSPASADAGRLGLESDKKHRSRRSMELKLRVHIATILMRRRYIMHLCRAFMKFGAPTHRLEEFMRLTANVLEVEAQFIYLPECMIMAFDDSLSATSEVKLIRTVQGLDLERLADIHLVYKSVVHDMVAVDKAIEELDEIISRPPRYGVWMNIALRGFACVFVGPWAFGARPIDLPIIFALGCLAGFMQQVLAPRSSTYSNVLEVSIALVTSFISRAVGSIRSPHGAGGFVFCFSAIAQSSISIIFPGFSVLSSSLELQSHQIVPGSIRLVHTIIYSLFLGYGVTMGTTVYGLLDANASSETSCAAQSESVWGNTYVQHFVWAPLYIFTAALMSQAKLKQTPVIVFIGMAGYTTNYFVTGRLGSNEGVANAVGAFTLGLLANLYSRLWHGHAVIAIIPGIWTMVSSGLASSGSILSGVEYANLVKQGLAKDSASMLSVQMSLAGLGWSMVQIAIGLTVGLFIAALIVYPSGKRRSGLFSL